VFQPKSIDIINYYADTGEWHPATWFLYTEHRKLVSSEMERINKYREKGDYGGPFWFGSYPNP
jgi:hypothetical protein